MFLFYRLPYTSWFCDVLVQTIELPTTAQFWGAGQAGEERSVGRSTIVDANVRVPWDGKKKHIARPALW